MNYQQPLKYLLLYSLFVSLTACSQEENTKSPQIITAERKATTQSLFFTGTIKPMRTLVITSPADGVVIDMPFQYGEAVVDKQLLFIISSAKFLTDYKAALMQYIKAKSEYNNSQTQLTEAQFLHKNQLISADEFKTKRSNFYVSRLSLLQAQDALENLTAQLEIKDKNLYQLTVADIDKITKALHLQDHSENLRILSQAPGIVLSAHKNDEDTKKIAKGDAVKQGDVLAMIGDMSGVSVAIKISEMAINQIKIGQPVKVTGVAFPGTLKGKITHIDRQGETSNGGLPTFSAEVIVPKLTAKERREIHAGMSAKIEILIAEEPQIILPIQAIKEKSGISYVEVYNDKLKRNETVEVITGKTSAETVTILSGIKAGDKIVLPN